MFTPSSASSMTPVSACAKRTSIASSPKRGSWAVTPKGIEYLQHQPVPFSAAEVERLATVYKTVETLRPRDAVPVEPVAAAGSTPESSVLSPDDRLDQALAELRDATANELHDSLLQVSPARFGSSSLICCTNLAMA